MLAVLSPAKALDFEGWQLGLKPTRPRLNAETGQLVQIARGQSRRDLKRLMKISDRLVELNYQRFQAFDGGAKPAGAKPAILAFNGDTYTGFDAATLSEDDLAFSQDHVRILSGLYGVLRPLDLIQPYRLEMGSKLQNGHGEDLYDFWQGKITALINKDLSGEKNPVLINLASNEYFKSIQPKNLNATVITPVFKEIREGQAKIISFSAKRARGMMARFMVENRISRLEELKKFDAAGYRFIAGDSDDSNWLFLRAKPN